MKAIFTQNPDLSVFQVTFIKALISSLILVVSFNKNIKTIMVDSVDVDSVFALVFKTIQGSVGVLFAYMAIRTFNVSTVGILSSMAPLLVCVLAHFILGE